MTYFLGAGRRNDVPNFHLNPRQPTFVHYAFRVSGEHTALIKFAIEVIIDVQSNLSDQSCVCFYRVNLAIVGRCTNFALFALALLTGDFFNFSFKLAKVEFHLNILKTAVVLLTIFKKIK